MVRWYPPVPISIFVRSIRDDEERRRLEEAFYGTTGGAA